MATSIIFHFNEQFHKKKYSLYVNRNTCVFIKETADAPPLLPNTSSAVEIVAGFPTCPKSDNFTIIGNALDAALQPDGSLEINGAVLPSGQFCVERIKELNQIAKVFACPEHAPQRLVPVIIETVCRDIFLDTLLFSLHSLCRVTKADLQTMIKTFLSVKITLRRCLAIAVLSEMQLGTKECSNR